MTDTSIAGPFPEDKYKNQGLDQLVVYCVKRILDHGEECTFERLVYECFTSFPQKFGLERYPEWPDSARVNKSWLRCRTDKKWIVGSVKSGFALTPSGKKIAELVEAEISGKTNATASRVKPEIARYRERWESILKNIRNHPTFRRFQKNPNQFTPTPEELRDVLMTTLETPIKLVRRNLDYFKNIAEEYHDRDVVKFLDMCVKFIDNGLS